MRLDLLASQAFFPLFDPSLSNWEYVVFSVVLWGTEEPTAEQIASLTPTDDGNISNNYSVKVLYDPKETYDERPVRLVSFNANESEVQNVFGWSIAVEEISSYFSIERSSNGKVFKEIGTTSARGDTERVSYYSFTDANLIPGILYYRLKMIDLDGTYVYSPIVSVKGKQFREKQLFKLYPNPTTSSVKMDIEANTAINGRITIIDMTGKAVKTSLKNFYAGNNTIDIGSEQLVTGLYHVEVV